MNILGAPICGHHEGDVSMRLRTLHTDSARPEQLLGLYECPDCGEERRWPVNSSEVA